MDLGASILTSFVYASIQGYEKFYKYCIRFMLDWEFSEVQIWLKLLKLFFFYSEESLQHKHTTKFFPDLLPF